MSSNRWRVVTWPFLLVTLASPLLVNCKGLPGGDKLGALNDLNPSCPVETASIDAIAKADWGAALKIDAKAGAQIKGSLQAALNLQKLAAEIDGELKVACGNLAKDLGGTADAKDGPTQCQAAIKVMGDLKASMGASATFAIDIVPPKCSASMSAAAECSGKCEGNVSGPKAEVKCEGGEISGECGAKCEGSCDVSAGAACEGECGGSCEGDFSGTCGGKCDGKCDGKAGPKGGGECKGKCEGKCDAKAQGACKGTCKGNCALKAGGSCKGTCSGRCSVEMKAPKCSGKVTPPKASADCSASCDAEVSGKLECTPASVKLAVKGAANADASAKYQAAIEKNLPAILKVAIGMKDRLEGVAKAGEQVVAGAKATVEVAGKGDKKIALKLAACVAMPFKGAIDAVASVKANVNVSVDVKASASASGSGSAKAGG
jgi:hypothetical protein